MNKDEMSDDAQFDAFLKGEGDLSRRLQALAQPSPSAELDAAIIARARLAVAQQGREAANDPGIGQAAKPQRARGLGMRWRVPAGIAATVLAGLIGQQTFQQGGFDTMQDTPADTVSVVEQAATPAPAMEAPPVVTQGTRSEPPMPREKQVEQKKAMMERRSEQAADASAVVAAPPPPAPAPVAAPAPQFIPSPPPPPPVPAAARAPAENSASPLQEGAARAKSSQQAVTVTGSRIRAAHEADPAAWLVTIDALLKEGKNPEAAAEWARFRKTYPDYAVPEATENRLDAIPKAADLY